MLEWVAWKRLAIEWVNELEMATECDLAYWLVEGMALDLALQKGFELE